MPLDLLKLQVTTLMPHQGLSVRLAPAFILDYLLTAFEGLPLSSLRDLIVSLNGWVICQ